jgi:secondary thiamine-phosphate synthase enzyme
MVRDLPIVGYWMQVLRFLGASSPLHPMRADLCTHLTHLLVASNMTVAESVMSGKELSMVYGMTFSLRTKGFSDVKDITGEVQSIVSKSGIREGLAHVFVLGSTASISTIEYEPALVEDLRDELEKLVPSSQPSRHSRTWGDDNGFSHLRATLMGPGMSVPVAEGRLLLGTWQQIVVIDHDNRGRERKIHVQVLGE